MGRGRPCIELEILEESTFYGCVDESGDEECSKKFEVGRECASGEMEGVRNKICVACEIFAKIFVV